VLLSVKEWSIFGSDPHRLVVLEIVVSSFQVASLI